MRLQRDGALEPLVARLVHHAHAALAELAGDGVVPEALRALAVVRRPGLELRLTAARRTAGVPVSQSYSDRSRPREVLSSESATERRFYPPRMA